MVSKVLWVVPFPTMHCRPQRCWELLHTTANTDTTTQPTLLAQQCWGFLRPFSRSFIPVLYTCSCNEPLIQCLTES